MQGMPAQMQGMQAQMQGMPSQMPAQGQFNLSNLGGLM
jgi:hypothetical protein